MENLRYDFQNDFKNYILNKHNIDTQKYLLKS